MRIEPEKVQGPILRFFGRPVIGIAGSIASIIGLVLAVYFFRAGKETRDLRYFVHPAKAIVVKTGQSSRLRVTLDGAAVERDVTAAQLAFWNEGDEPIRQSHMLNPLVIRTGTNVQILEARVRKTMRDVSGITLDLTRINYGEVRVNWTILERFDGGVIQLIYLGDANSPISATGIVEGQGTVRALEFEGGPEKYSRQGGSNLRIVGYVYLVLGLLFGLLGVYRLQKYRFRDNARGRGWILIFVSLITILMAIYLVFWLGAKPGPPFGFD